MPLIRRVGLLPNLHDPAQRHLHRAAVVITAHPHTETRWGRAAAGHVGEPVGSHRLPDIGAVVIWGSDASLVAGMVDRQRCALMLVVVPFTVLPAEVVDAITAAAAEAGCVVQVVILNKTHEVRAYDLGAGRVFGQVADITRPPQQQLAPSVPRDPNRVPRGTLSRPRALSTKLPEAAQALAHARLTAPAVVREIDPRPELDLVAVEPVPAKAKPKRAKAPAPEAE